MKATVPTLWKLLPWIGLACALAGLWLLGWQLSETRRELATLRGWQATMLDQIATAAGRPRPLAAADGPSALSDIIARRDATVAMAGSTPVTAPPPTALPVAGTTDSSTEISRLRRTQSTGSAAGDARIIDQDSRAAWTGWK